MQTIDEISIGREGDMFTLTIYHYSDNPDSEGDSLPFDSQSSTTFLIGLPDQFHQETQRTIGQWLTRAVEPQPVSAVERARSLAAEFQWPFSPDALTHDAQGDND